MLEQLFGSATRVKILRLFFNNPDQAYFVRELTRRLEQRINSVRQELSNLKEIGIVEEIERDRKKYYSLAKEFPLYSELKALMIKSQILLERDFARSISQLGNVKYLALSGMFVGRKDLPTDLLIIGSIDRKKLQAVLNKFQKYFEQDVNFTVFTHKEFEYRRQVTDRFLFAVLENNKIVIVDKLTKKGQSEAAGPLPLVPNPPTHDETHFSP